MIAIAFVFERELETSIHPPTYSPIHLLFFFLPLLVAVLRPELFHGIVVNSE
ncbi:MAG: hypothetical protein ACLQBD_19855 [Syntrophobacteraceae bacterium]